MPNITEKLCKEAEPNARYWDDAIPGFAIFTGKTAVTFYYQHNRRGKTNRTKLGRWPLVKVADARKTASRMALQRMGATGRELAADPIPTLQQALDKYLNRGKLRSDQNKATVRNQIEGHLSDWLDEPLNHITRAMVDDRYEDLCVRRPLKNPGKGRHTYSGGPSAANHTFRSFRAIWNHAARIHEDLPRCPTIVIEWVKEEPPKLVIPVLANWKAQVDTIQNPVHAAFWKFLLFTGCRPSEARNLRWEDVRMRECVFRDTKNGRDHRFPLLKVHRDILAPLKEANLRLNSPSPYVFPGKYDKLKSPERLEWNAQAHRRTFATKAQATGIDSGIVSRLMNHTPQDVTQRRYVNLSVEECKPYMQQVVDRILSETEA